MEITTPEITETEITTPEVTEITINPECVPAVIIMEGSEDHRKLLRKPGFGPEIQEIPEITTPEIPEVLMSHVQITEIMDYIGIIKIIIKIMVLAIRTETAQDHKNVAAIAMALQFVNIPIIMAVVAKNIFFYKIVEKFDIKGRDHVQVNCS